MKKLLFLLLLCGCTAPQWRPGTHIINTATGQHGVIEFYNKSYGYKVRLYEYKNGYLQPEATAEFFSGGVLRYRPENRCQ